MAKIKGIPIILHDRVQTGVDAFRAPTYEEKRVTVENVLVCPVSTQDITTDFQLYGKRLEYELCIPKEDTHTWEDRVVEFFGAKWKVFGFPMEWIGKNVPLAWNRKVKVERYG